MVPLAEYAFSCNERALVQRLGLYVFALGSIEKCEIVHAVERLGMVFAEHALRQCQRLPGNCGCLGILAEVV